MIFEKRFRISRKPWRNTSSQKGYVNLLFSVNYQYMVLNDKYLYKYVLLTSTWCRFCYTTSQIVHFSNWTSFFCCIEHNNYVYSRIKWSFQKQCLLEFVANLQNIFLQFSEIISKNKSCLFVHSCGAVIINTGFI